MLAMLRPGRTQRHLDGRLVLLAPSAAAAAHRGAAAAAAVHAGVVTAPSIPPAG
jgi:hypothetical protein